MTPPTESTLQQIINDFVDPHLDLTLQESGAIISIDASGTGGVNLMLSYPSKRYWPQLELLLQEQLCAADINNVTINLSQRIAAHTVQHGVQRLAEESDINLLGALPLDVNICNQADSGEPTVIAEPDRCSQ